MGELLEREGDVERLSALLARAAAGAGGLAVVEGPPGIGKTSVLEAVAARARAAGMAVLLARGSEAERDFAFGVVRQLFERRVAGAAPAERRRLLAGAAALAGPALSAGGGAGSGDVQAVLHGLYWLCANLASDGPVLLAVDDAPWADSQSLRFCEYVARRLDELPVLLLLTARSVVADARLAGAAAMPGAVLLRLAALSEPGVAAMVRSAHGEERPEVAAAASRVTGGNPFLVRELLRWHAGADEALPDEGAPPSVQVWIAARLARCGDDARRVAAAAAVLDPRADLDRVAALAGLPLDRTAAAADELAAAVILGESRPCRFAHPLVRSAVLSAVPGGERSTLHRRAAELLAASGAEPAEVARHLTETDPAGEGWARDALATAAEDALRRGEPAAAARWLRRALAEPLDRAGRASLLHRLALAEQRLGEPAATAHLREAFALLDDPAARAPVLRALLLGLLTERRVDEVTAMLETTLPALSGTHPDLAMGLEAELLSAGRHTLTSSLWVADRLRRWRGRAGPDSAGGRLLLANLATQCALDGGAADEAAGLAAAALAGGRLLDEQSADAMPVYQAVWQLTAAERLDEAADALATALADARRRGSAAGFATASLFLSYVELLAGRVAGAEAHASAALEAAAQVGPDWFALPAVVAGVVDVDVERDRHAEAERLLVERGLDGPVGDSVPLRLLLWSRGRLRLAAGRPAEAVDDLLELAGRERRLQALSTHLAPHQVEAALALHAAGRPEEAGSFAVAGLAAARAWGTPRAVARALRAVARLEPPAGAAATLAGAADLLRGSPCRLEEAWVRMERGAALARAGLRTEAGAELRAALDLGHACGGRAVERTARERLVACGYRPRRAASTGVDALTGSELEVARLAAGGLSNRAIAQALFVTERTVELHLTNAYRKLGIDSRRDLRSALGG